MVADRKIWLSFGHRGGYATLRQQPPPPTGPAWQQPHGVLYALSAADLQKLAASERGYRIGAVEVCTYDGRRTSAAAFLSSPLLQLWEPVPPLERYRALLLEGCDAHGLDAEYSAWLRALGATDSRAAAARDARYDACPAQALAQLLAAGAVAGAAWAATRV